MDASRDGKCHKDADEHTGLQRGTTINIQVALLGGQTLSFETHLCATVSDIKALIHEQLGRHPRVQMLILDTTILADSSALLKDVAVNDGSLLSLTFSNEPLGQSLLTEPAGKMMELSRRGTPHEVLNEFQLMSLQAALLHHDPAHADSDHWGNLGAWSIDLYWTTRSNKCRYEYWSTAPGDNELGALIRIDADSVTCIGEGSDDGLFVFRNFHDDRAAMKLVCEGWPRFERQEEAEETDEDSDHSKDEKEAMNAIKAMKKLTPAAKKKAIKKLPLNVQIKVAMAMKASASTTVVPGVFDATTGGGLFGAAPATTGGGLFGAPRATTGNSLFGAAPATTAGGLFGGGSLSSATLVETGSGFFGAATATPGGGLFGAALVTTGGGLFGDAMTGGGLFGAPATTGGGLCSTSQATTGDGLGLFGPAPATTAGGIFGSGGLFGARLVATDGDLFGAATATTSGCLSGAASATTGGSLFGDTTTGCPFGEALATTGSGHFGAALVATGAGACYSSPVEATSKQDECKTQ